MSNNKYLESPLLWKNSFKFNDELSQSMKVEPNAYSTMNDDIQHIIIGELITEIESELTLISEYKTHLSYELYL